MKQSYSDQYDNYLRSLKDESLAVWDHVVLTASNEAQALSYKYQLDSRLKNGLLNKNTKYHIISDPDGKRVGSGGATLNALKYIHDIEGTLDGLRILVIHSGGDSKRIPHFSACGKLFSPVPRELFNGRRSTLFDEIMIEACGVCGRVGTGMLVCSGDVLLLFNPLQIDYQGAEAAVFSVKESVDSGVNHGVYLRDDNMFVGEFLHKKSKDRLKKLGAVDKNNKVDIDTGVVFMSTPVISELYSLVDTDEKFNKYVNDHVRLSFYADFLFPMATNITLAQYRKETPEGDFSPELDQARTVIWKILNKFRMKMLCLSPASFIHFGTTKEYHKLMTEDIDDYRHLGWKRSVASNVNDPGRSYNNSLIKTGAVIGKDTYIEDSIIGPDCVIGKNCIISSIELKNARIPNNSVIHALKLNDGTFTVRFYGLADNPKNDLYFGKEIGEPLWTAKLFPVCDTVEEALDTVLSGRRAERYTSLCESFNQADAVAITEWRERLFSKIRLEKTIDLFEKRICIYDAVNGDIPNDDSNITKKRLSDYAGELKIDSLNGFSNKIRAYNYLAAISGGKEKTEYLQRCYHTVSEAILSCGRNNFANRIISKDSVKVSLPVRINFGGGWSDTPPHCIENGGTVLNAAILLDGKYPVEAEISKTERGKIVFSSKDNHSSSVFTDIKELRNCGDPFDPFALHKAVLMSSGLIPDGDITVDELTEKWGGGFHLSTNVINIPRGSGLGTSSILAAACVKALDEFFGVASDISDQCRTVLCAEQIMSTGGGWQDQIGALVPGVKLVISGKGYAQDLEINQVNIEKETVNRLEKRMCLIFTGQRRLARHLLRDIVGKYISSDPDTVYALKEIQNIAVLMKYELERDNIDGFASLMNKHWELSKMIDSGCTNTCIDLILDSVDDLICGKMICGAGGGGFLQVMLKEGISKRTLDKRLDSIFADSGTRVWNYSFIV